MSTLRKTSLSQSPETAATTYRSTLSYPLVYVAPMGTISIVLPHDIVISIAVDKTVRIACYDKFAIACNGKGSLSAILHPNARIYQDGEKVYANFYTDTKKTAVLGAQGVLFTMDHLKDSYVVSANAYRGTSALSSDLIQFAKLDFDFTMRLFYTDAQMGYVSLCNEIVQKAHYEQKDGSLITLINGFYICQKINGDVEMKCRPRNIFISPSTGEVQIRTSSVDMAVQGDKKAHVKRGNKRVHVSRSGMVVSDGFCTTSMDHFGNIVST